MWRRNFGSRRYVGISKSQISWSKSGLFWCAQSVGGRVVVTWWPAKLHVETHNQSVYTKKRILKKEAQSNLSNIFTNPKLQPYVKKFLIDILNHLLFLSHYLLISSLLHRRYSCRLIVDFHTKNAHFHIWPKNINCGF